MTANRPEPAPDLIARVRQLAIDRDLLPSGSIILAAVSGGADSLAMLLILDSLKADLSFQLHCLHINHGLRGKTADAEEEFVRGWCQRLDIPFYSRPVATKARARAKRIGLEEAGRELRRELYAQLARQLEKEKGQPVLVALAHHLDDQAETIMMHLGRGSGLDGLGGMLPAAGILVRPMLGCRRQEIEQWLTSRSVSWCHDHTNDELFTIRNKLRHLVLPAWAQALGYDPAGPLVRAAENLSLDRSYLDQAADAAYQECRQADALDQAALLACHPAILSRVLRLYWREKSRHGQDLGQKHIHNIISWLQDARTGQGLDLPHNYRISLDYGLVRLGRQTPVLPEEDDRTELKLRLPGRTASKTLNFEILAEFIENEEEIVYNGAMEYFRYERILDCSMRRRLPQDRIRPDRHSGSKTLKKFLQEKKVPARERPGLVLLARGHDIVWLPGLAAGADYLAGPGHNVDRIVRLSWSRLDKQ